MPHNRKDREREVRNRYEFVVFGGEYHLGHAVLAVIDGYYTGGQVTWATAKQELKSLFVDVAQKMIDEGLDPTSEPIYVDKFVFENWEEVLGNKIPLPNKFVPYVAARKKNNPVDQAGQPVHQLIREGKTYFFRGDKYVRFDHAADKVDAGYPKKITAGWSGAWAKDIDAAVHWPHKGEKGKVYFFRGDEYARFDIAADKVDSGYPKKISAGWSGVWVDGIDAAVYWPNRGEKGKTYFFRGNEYVRFDIATDKVDSGYPKKITAGWPSVWGEDIDASTA